MHAWKEQHGKDNNNYQTTLVPEDLNGTNKQISYWREFRRHKVSQRIYVDEDTINLFYVLRNLVDKEEAGTKILALKVDTNTVAKTLTKGLEKMKEN